MHDSGVVVVTVVFDVPGVGCSGWVPGAVPGAQTPLIQARPGTQREAPKA